MPNPPTAISGEGHPPYEEEFRVIGEILERDAEPIMERWYERASEEQVHASEERREEAMDDLLGMLRSLGQRLREQSRHAFEHATKLAHAHGRQRSGIEWDVVSLVRDYEILHGVALEHLGRVLDERLTYRQAMVLATVFDRATGSAVEAFNRLAQQELERANRKLDEQVRRQKAELRQLTLDLSEAEHRERQRIAEALHDDVQQILVATRLKLQAALGRATPDRDAAEEAQGLLNQAIEISRNVTRDLHPTVLEHRGLPAAIEWLAETFQKRYDLAVTVDLQVGAESNPGPMPLRRLVYGAVRELLFNVVKHAQTDRAWVRICCDERSPWRIEVEDRGVGTSEMDTTGDPPAQASFGLSSVRRRIEQVGGTVEASSEPGEGTRVVLIVPLEPASPAER